MRSTNIKLFVVLGGFIFSRLAIIFFFVDSIYWREELHVGLIAREIMGGIRMPLLAYIVEPYSFGKVFFAHLLVPFISILGDSQISYYFFVLFIASILILLWYEFISEYFCEKVAFIFGLLCIFSPSIFTNANLVLWLPRFHTVHISLIFSLILFYRIIYRGKQATCNYALLGISCGIGFLFDYLSLIPTALIFIFINAKKERFILSKHFFVFLISFLFCAIPWFIYNYNMGFVGLYDERNMQTSILSFANSSDISADVRWVFSRALMHLFYFNGSGIWIRFLYYTIFFLSVIGLIVLNIKNFYNFFKKSIFRYKKEHTLTIEGPDFFFVFLLIVYIIAFIVVDRSAKIRYFIPLYPLIFLIISNFLSRIFKQKIHFLWPLIFILAFCFIKDINARDIYFGPKQVFKYKAYGNYEDLGQTIFWRQHNIKRAVADYIKKGEPLEIILLGYLYENPQRFSAFSKLTQMNMLNQYQKNLLNLRIKDWLWRMVREGPNRKSIFLDEIINSVVDTRKMDELPSQFDYNWDMFSAVKAQKIKEYIERLDLSSKQRAVIYESLGASAAYANNLSALRVLSENINHIFIKDLYRGFGYGYAYVIDEDFINGNIPIPQKNVQDIFKQIFQVYDRIPDNIKGYFRFILEGYFSNPDAFCFYELQDDYFLPMFDLKYLLAYPQSNFHKDLVPYFYRGIGRNLGALKVTKRLGAPRLNFFISKVPQASRKHVINGISDLQGFCGIDQNDVSAYRQFIALNKQYRRPISKAESWKQIKDAKEYLRKNPSGEVVEDLRNKIISELNIGFLLDDLAQKKYDIKIISIQEHEGFKEEELIFTDHYIGSFNARMLVPNIKSKSYPAVIGLHGHEQSAEIFIKDYMGQDLVKEGFIVLAPSFRAMDDDEVEFTISEELYLEGFPLMGLRIYETLLLIEYLKNQENVNKIGIMGHSGGSDVAYMVSIISNDLKALVFDMYPLQLDISSPGRIHCETIPGLSYYSHQINTFDHFGMPKFFLQYGYARSSDRVRVKDFFKKNIL